MLSGFKETFKNLIMVHGDVNITRKRRNGESDDFEVDEENICGPKRLKVNEVKQVDYTRRPIRNQTLGPQGFAAKFWGWFAGARNLFSMDTKKPLQTTNNKVNRSNTWQQKSSQKRADLVSPSYSQDGQAVLPSQILSAYHARKLEANQQGMSSHKKSQLSTSLRTSLSSSGASGGNSSISKGVTQKVHKPAKSKQPKNSAIGGRKYPFWQEGVKHTFKVTSSTPVASVRLQEKEQYRQLIAQLQKSVPRPDLNASFLSRIKDNGIRKASPNKAGAFCKTTMSPSYKQNLKGALKRKQQTQALTLSPWQQKTLEEQGRLSSPLFAAAQKYQTDSPVFLGERRISGTSHYSPALKYLPKPSAVQKSIFSKSQEIVWKPGVVDLVDSDEEEITFLKEVPQRRKSMPSNALRTSQSKPLPSELKPYEPPYRRHAPAEESVLGQPNWIQELKQSLDQDCKVREQKIRDQERITEELQEKREASLKALNKKLFEDLRLRTVVISDQSEDEEDESNRLPPITTEMGAKIEAALQPNPPDEILARGHGLQITRRDMETLSGLNWLNDEVINYYFALIVERGKQDNYPSCYAFNTFFYPRLIDKGHDGIKRWTKKVDIFSYKLILIPVHLGLHWCLAVIDFRQKKIMYYDSMGGQNNECLNSLKMYLQDESQDKRSIEYDTSAWKLEAVKNIPQQMNGSDCGMFALKYGEYITRHAKITFTQSDMPYFRQKTVYEIITNKIL